MMSDNHNEIHTGRASGARGRNTMIRKGHTGGYKVLGLILGLAVAFFAVGVTGALAQGRSSAVAVETGAGGRYIVVFNDGVSDPRGLAVALGRQHGFTVRLAYSSALSGFAATLPGAAVNALANDPRVAFVEADQLAYAFAQTAPTGVQRIFADANSNIAIDGYDDDRIDVDVAVIDTGVADHPDLNVVGRVDCTGGPFNTKCKNGGSDGNGHGTHVAGTIAALDNDIGVVGVAPGARIWAVKVLKNNGSGYISGIVGGIDWVTAHGGIEVANMSLGCECTSAALDQAIANSVASGVTYAVAAGNSGKDASTFTPANHPDVITVSALADFDGAPGGLGSPTCRTDQDDTLADFSNFGSTVEVAAPGVCIESTWNDGGLKTISGTSMASPHVAGAAALLAASGLTDPAAIRTAIVANGNFDWTDDSGDGIKEPLLDVGNSTVFNPATVPGSGGGGPVNTAPTALITAPADSATFDSGTTVNFTGTASDNEDGELTASLAWTSNLDGTLGSGGAVSAALSDGTHTITASVTDSDSASGSDSISVTVGTPPPPPAEGTVVSIASIVYGFSGGKDGMKNMTVTVSLEDDLGQPVPDAVVSVDINLTDTSRHWIGSATTGAEGSVVFKVIKSDPGCYTTTVTDISDDRWDGAQNDGGACK